MIKVIDMSLLLRKTTPSSLILLLRNKKVFQTKSHYNDIKSLLSHIDKMNLFLVIPSEIRLKQHFQFGLCDDRHCYFCKLKKPLEISTQQELI